MKKVISRIALAVSLVSLFAFGLAAHAATVSVGNDSAARTQVDTYSNFTVIDTNHPVDVDGTLTQFNYYAANTNPFRFVLVDGSNVVKWISDEITPATGDQTYTPSSGVDVSAGWNLGVYSASTGVIPFEFVGSPAQYTPNSNGLPTVGATLAIEGSSNRTYSLGATGNTEEDNGDGDDVVNCDLGDSGIVLPADSKSCQLLRSGVEGKGILTAPGLLKPFKGKAALHAGKKADIGDEEEDVESTTNTERSNSSSHGKKK